MQSHLQAALLGQSNSNKSSNNAENEDNSLQEEDTEDHEEFDEETELENGHKTSSNPKNSSATLSKTVTLQMLLDGNILQPGYGAMTIEYLGQKFIGDLLPDGKIRSQETDIVFASPSAWAVASKRFINPDKKSGCGWASVKYRGRKLDVYKNIWYRQKKEEQEKDSVEIKTNMATSINYSRIVVKHNTIANRTLTHDANTLIECVPFSNLGKIQPFLVTLSTNAALVADFHCHLTKTEVSGYLAGHWDFNTHNLQVTHAFPCRNTKSDRENALQVEMEIAKTIENEKLILVGWYHSHPFTAAAPTLRDIDAQLEYQIRMKGHSDNSYTPCIGLIISPYNFENTSMESSIIAYWVIPPPETKPNEYGRPMLMSYSVSQDSTLTNHVKHEITACADYYKKEKDFVNFNERYIGVSLFIDKLKSTLFSKFPRDEKETTLWKFIRESVGCTVEENEGLISIPSVKHHHHLMPNLNSMMDLSSLFYNSDKFSGGSSILGLPDPMAHSTLAANNMFLQSNLFKMQELLKPLSTSSPKQKETKPSSSSSPIKIPSTDLKSWKNEYLLNEMNAVKNSFLPPDLNVSKIDSSSINKSLNVSDFGLNLSKHGDEKEITKDGGDVDMLDLSGKSENDKSLNLSNKNLKNVTEKDEIPLNLTQ